MENSDYWHLTHAKGILSHNVFLGKGHYFSVSEINRDPILKNAVTGYGHHAQFDNKERAWERIRRSEFPDLPTRVNAIFLFESEKDGERAKSEWFNDDARLLVQVNILPGSRLHRADARWLDLEHANDAQERARSYWGGEMTSDPRVEIVVSGRVYFPGWENWARLMTP